MLPVFEQLSYSVGFFACVLLDIEFVKSICGVIFKLNLSSYNIPLYEYASFLIHSTLKKCVGCFQFEAIMNNVAMNLFVFVSLGYIPRVEFPFFFFFLNFLFNVYFWETETERE